MRGSLARLDSVIDQTGRLLELTAVNIPEFFKILSRSLLHLKERSFS